MHRACTRLRQRNPNLFIVESLFANNEQGAWYDPSDLNTLFQDDAGTVPVTASGQTVGRMLDKSGRGNHAIQATVGSRPTFRDVNGLRFLEFDGVDDFLVTGTINFTVTDEMSLFAGVRKISDAAVGIITELSVDSNVQNGAFFLAGPGANGSPNFAFRSNGTVRPASSSATLAAPVTAVVTGVADISAPSQLIRSNGVNGTMIATSQGVGSYGNHALYIGRRGGATLPFNGNLYGLIVRGVLSDSNNISSAERYLAAKTGVTLS